MDKRAIQITDLDDERINKLTRASLLLCCRCGNTFRYSNGYDACYCSEKCCKGQDVKKK